MSYPNPHEAPEKKFEFLQGLNLNTAVTAFVHSQNKPFPGPTGRFSEHSMQVWCEQMDILLVSTHQLIY